MYSVVEIVRGNSSRRGHGGHDRCRAALNGEVHRTAGRTSLRIEKISRHDILGHAVGIGAILRYHNITFRRVRNPGDKIYDLGITGTSDRCRITRYRSLEGHAPDSNIRDRYVDDAISTKGNRDRRRLRPIQEVIVRTR